MNVCHVPLYKVVIQLYVVDYKFDGNHNCRESRDSYKLNNAYAKLCNPLEILAVHTASTGQLQDHTCVSSAK